MRNDGLQRFRVYLKVGPAIMKLDSYGFNFADAKNSAIMKCGMRFPSVTTRFLGGQHQVSPMTIKAAVTLD